MLSEAKPMHMRSDFSLQIQPLKDPHSHPPEENIFQPVFNIKNSANHKRLCRHRPHAQVEACSHSHFRQGHDIGICGDHLQVS